MKQSLRKLITIFSIMVFLIISLPSVVSFEGTLTEIRLMNNIIIRVSDDSVIHGISTLDFSEIQTIKKELASIEMISTQPSMIAGRIPIQFRTVGTAANRLKERIIMGNNFTSVIDIVSEEIITQKEKLRKVLFPGYLQAHQFQCESSTIDTRRENLSEKTIIGNASQIVHGLGVGNWSFQETISRVEETSSRIPVESSAAHTVTIVTTTPLTQVFNPFPRSTAVVLKGGGYFNEQHLGDRTGGSPIRVNFPNVPSGSFEFQLIWGNSTYTKRIDVGDKLHFDFTL